MIEDAREGDHRSVQLGRSRFWFGLSALCVLILIAGLWLGWRVADERYKAAIVARNVALVDAIEARFLEVPDGAQFNSSFEQRQYQWLVNRQDPATPGKYSYNGRFHRLFVRGDTSDISEMLATGSAQAANDRLRAHFEQGLAKLGLHPTEKRGGGTTMLVEWELPERGISVAIDFDANVTEKRVDVRIYVRHSEPLSFW